MGKTNIDAKFILNSTNNLNCKETLPEFIAGESNNNNNKQTNKNMSFSRSFF
jgi:hypothetical protein